MERIIEQTQDYARILEQEKEKAQTDVCVLNDGMKQAQQFAEKLEKEQKKARQYACRLEQENQLSQSIAN